MSDVPYSEELARRHQQLPRPHLCYLEIPAMDPRKSAEFYKNVFGWNIRRAESDRPSFDDASSVSGAFVTYLKPGQEAGILPSIWVRDIEGFVEKIEAHGGQIVERPRPEPLHDFQKSLEFLK